MKKTLKGYKGFDKDFKCRGFQYEEGKTYTHKGDIKLCDSGFHFCENPMDIFTYYIPSDSRFAEIEAMDVDSAIDTDSKRVAKKIKIGVELDLHTICNLGAKFIIEKVDFTNSPSTNTGNWSASTNTGDRSASTNTGNWSASTNTGDRSASTNTGYRSASTNTGDQSASTNTGDQSASTNTGDQSASTNTGYRSASTNTGKEGCAISLGIEGIAKGAMGCWLTLAEWKNIDNEWHRIDVQTKIIDNKDIKENVFYKLVNGQFIEVK